MKANRNSKNKGTDNHKNHMKHSDMEYDDMGYDEVDEDTEFGDGEDDDIEYMEEDDDINDDLSDEDDEDNFIDDLSDEDDEDDIAGDFADEDDTIEDLTDEDGADEDDIVEDDIEFLDEFDLPEKAARPKKSNLHINMHILLITVIVLIAAVSVFRLYKWNKGTALDTDTGDIDLSQFDVEALDMIIPMDASLLEGREDDGVTTILCFGNNPFTDDHDESSLASQIAAKTDAVVYDCAFPDSSVACKYPEYNPQYTRDHFNFYYVVECLRNNEFTAISSIANDEPDPRYADTVEVMKSVDMDKVDVIVIMYDSTDYNQGTVADNPNNPYDVTAYTGGLRTTINNIKNTWPYIRILVMSHSYAQYMDDDGNLYNGTLKDIGNGTLHHYLLMEAEAAMDCGVSFIDNYFGTINEDNYEEYMSNYMHYNDAGREKLAERVADVINNKMGIVSSGSGAE